MPFRVGIDLGTTNCALAIVTEQLKEPYIFKNSDDGFTTPSVIYFEKGEPIVGIDAKEKYVEGDPNCVAFFKRSMGEKKDGKDDVCFVAEKDTQYERWYTAVDLSAIMLLHLKNEVEHFLGDSISEAVISCPAYFFSNERDCILRAADSIGLRVKELIEEPAAAAIAYGLRHWRIGARVLVYDLGGGTFDVSIVEMQDALSMSVIGTMGQKFLGGKDFDGVLFQLIIDALAQKADIRTSFISDEERAIIKGHVEIVKKKLSSMQSVRFSEYIDGKNITVDILRSDFEDATMDLLKNTDILIDRLLSDTGIDIDGITDVLLVGGSTHMPQVKVFLEKKFGKPPLTHANPDTAVAMGAAVRVMSDMDFNSITESSERHSKISRSSTSPQASRKIDTGSLKLLKITKSATHAMGTIAVSADGSKYINEIIVPSGERIPVKCTKTLRFATKEDGSSVVDIYLIQGNEQRPLSNKIQSRYIASSLRHNIDGRTYIRIQYEYDNSGIINVRVRQELDDFDLPIHKYEVPSDMRWTDGAPVREKLENSFGGRTEPLSILLFFDTSYSMDGTPIKDAQKAACEFVDSLLDCQSGIEIGIGVVANKSKILVQPTNDPHVCIGEIDKMSEIVEAGEVGYGNSGHPFDEILTTFKNVTGEKLALVLADGAWESQNRAIHAARECNNNGIETVGIGFGSADKTFLCEISSKTDFDFDTFVQSSGGLSELFGNLAQSLGKSESKFPPAEPWD